MRWSRLPVIWRLIALALLAAIMGVVAFAAHWLAYDAIPKDLIGYVGVAIIAFAAGVVTGESATLRSIRKRGG